MFGTSGIRGKYPDHVDEMIGFKVGYVIDKDFVISRDTRRTALPVFHSTIAGGLSSGKRVYTDNLGVAPTPTLSFASSYYDKMGIMITASHNPETDCGIKIFKDGKELSKTDEKKIESGVNNWDPHYSDSGRLDYVDIVKPHFDFLRHRFESAGGRKMPKIVVDTNGAASVITPYLLSSFGCEVVTINTGTYGFYRPSEPTPDHLSLLSSTVVTEGADFGIAHDGDADRAVLVDEKGVVLPQDIQLLMIVDYILSNKRGPVVSTVEASLSLEELVKKHNQKMYLTPVGSTNIGFKIEEVNAAFGGEPCGEYVYKDNVHTPDGIYTAGLFLEMFMQLGKFSSLREKYTSYPIRRKKYKAVDKSRTMNIVSDHITGLIEEHGWKISNMDGIRVESDEFWALIRPSGTEQVIRLTVEAKTNEILNKMIHTFENIIVSSAN